MRPLRILHVAPYCELTWAYGGIPRVVGAQRQGLAALGHDVTVVATDALDAHARLPRPAGHKGGPWTLDSGSQGSRTVLCPNLSNRLAYRYQFCVPLGLRHHLERHSSHFDIAHLHGYHNLPGVFAARVLRRARVPYVVQPNGTFPRLERRKLAKLAFDLAVGRNVAAHAAKIIAVSEAEREALVRHGVAATRIAVVPNPVWLEEARDGLVPGAFRKRIGLGDAPFVLYLGQLSPRKRVDLAVEALARVGHPELRLVVAGNDMGEEARVRRLVRRNALTPQVVLVGLLEGRARLEALADADLTVYPAEGEVFGLVALESLLCGTPVVVADDSGCGEVVRRIGGGAVVPAGDAGEVAEAMAAILAAPRAWRDSASAAATRIPRHFSPEAVATALVAVYDEVLSGAESEERPAP